jgi:hypothetical protein
MKKLTEKSRRILRVILRGLMIASVSFTFACMYGPAPAYGMPDAPMYGVPSVEEITAANEE